MQHEEGTKGKDAGPTADAGPGRPPAMVPPSPSELATLPSTLELNANWELEEAFSGLTFDDPVSLTQMPRSSHLFVSEREGRLYAFENRADVTSKTLVLDLTGKTQGENDSGLLGVAFHPEFGQPELEQGRALYVHYAFNSEPIVGTTPPFSTVTRSRLARFEIDLDTLKADPESELVLIDQVDESVWHQGGAMFFHPEDGFLYLSVGDEGSVNCVLNNCQRIDKDLFSGVLRIDVDQRGGDISHPIPRQPDTGVTANYFIPSDNPFVGVTNALEEFYALGLRNPHSMTHDRVDDVVWLGEVGQQNREEINILKRGGNYQWSVFEGSLRTGDPEPESRLGIWTDPLLEFGRQDARSIIGGYVYRGTRLPELVGKYVFGDFAYGRVWALNYELSDGEVNAGELELLLTSNYRNRENGITAFGRDSAGELYVLTLGNDAKILRLARSFAEVNVPKQLGQVGVFSDPTTLEPNSSLIPYSVQSPLWSDGALKRRWISLPPQAEIGFSATDPWRFPQGTVLVKHFEMPLDERHPEILTPLETRLLVIGSNREPYGMTYKWSSDGSTAELLLDAQTETLEVVAADGSIRTQQYFYPGPFDCLTCHNADAGYVLGVRTAQLNGPLQTSAVDASDGVSADAGAPTIADAGPEGAAVNQLAAWAELGLFGPDVGTSGPDLTKLNEYPRLVAIDDPSSSLEDRVRSYWDSNCSMCHGALDSIRANWDARFQTPLAEQGVLQVEALNAGLDGARFLIAPGDPDNSVLYQRNATLAADLRMPPLGSQRLDETYLAQLRAWIESLRTQSLPDQR